MKAKTVSFILYVLSGYLIPDIICGCTGMAVDLVFLIEESNTTTLSDFDKLLDFCADITGTGFTVSSTEARIGAVTYGENEHVLFSLSSYSHISEVQFALRNYSFQEDDLTVGDGSKALKFVSDNFLQRANGDRSYVDNYIIFFINNSDQGLIQTATRIRSQYTNIIAIGLNGVNRDYLSLITGDETLAFYLDDIDSVNSDLVTNVLSVLPSCPEVCQKSYFSYGNPGNLSRICNTNTGNMFLLTAKAFQPTCCGVISKWEFYPTKTGNIHFMVWRVNDTDFKLVGYNTITIKATDVGTTKFYMVPLRERIAIIQGDVIGWFSAELDLIPYDTCDTSMDLSCPNQILVGSISDLSEASVYRWSAAKTVSDRAYAIRYYTDENEPLQFTSNSYNVYIPNHKTKGHTVTKLELTGVDFTEEISINFTSTAEDIFTLDENKREITLLRNFTEDSDGKMYPALVTATDSCYHTASATFSLHVFNWPPVIKNLPRTIDISESLRTSVLLWTLQVEDHVGLHICCSIYDTDPFTLNFKLVKINSSFAIYTTSNPAFDYDDINSYIISICCEDGVDTTRSYLQVDIKEMKIKKQYIPPGWFFCAMIVGGVPIAIVFTLTCSIVFSVMFHPKLMMSLERPIAPQRTRKITKILEKFLPMFKRRTFGKIKYPVR